MTDPKRLLEAARELAPQARLMTLAAALVETAESIDHDEPRDWTLYRPKEAAAIVKISAWSLCAFARRGLIGRRVGRCWRFSPADLERVRNGLP